MLITLPRYTTRTLTYLLTLFPEITLGPEVNSMTNNNHNVCYGYYQHYRMNDTHPLVAYTVTLSAALSGKALTTRIGTWSTSGVEDSEEESVCCTSPTKSWTLNRLSSSVDSSARCTRSFSVAANPVVTEIGTRINCRKHNNTFSNMLCTCFISFKVVTIFWHL